jgi:hypothetical protein
MDDVDYQQLPLTPEAREYLKARELERFEVVAIHLRRFPAEVEDGFSYLTKGRLRDYFDCLQQSDTSMTSLYPLMREYAATWLAQDSRAVLGKLGLSKSSSAMLDYVFIDFERICDDLLGVPGSSPHLLEDAEPVGTANGEGEGPQDRTASWERVEILFISDERIQIRKGLRTETCNYAEFGFEDRRSGKPRIAWEVLRVMAKTGKGIQDTTRTGGNWAGVEKRMQEIRKLLRKHFGISGDPIPFEPGYGYRPGFTLACGPSFAA